MKRCFPFFAVFFILVAPQHSHAHCDTLAGPVAVDAGKALQTGKADYVLKWVRKEHEKEVLDSFRQAVVVRKQSPEARELADRYFLETVVRLHRAGEGEAFTGLKPGGTTDPAIRAADAAIASGDPSSMTGMLNRNVDEGVTRRFKRVVETRKVSETSVEAGRDYVEAYVDFVHFIERIDHDLHQQESHRH